MIITERGGRNSDRKRNSGPPTKLITLLRGRKMLVVIEGNVEAIAVEM